MANPYNSEVGQQDKAGGGGVVQKRPAGKKPGLRMDHQKVPKLPGKTGPKRNPWPSAGKIQEYTQSEGL